MIQSIIDFFYYYGPNPYRKFTDVELKDELKLTKEKLIKKQAEFLELFSRSILILNYDMHKRFISNEKRALAPYKTKINEIKRELKNRGCKYEETKNEQ